MLNKLKVFAYYFGVGVPIGMYAVMLYTFMKAWLHPAKAVLVTVDSFGEGDIEFVVLMLTVPCVAYACWKRYKRYANRKRQKAWYW